MVTILFWSMEWNFISVKFNDGKCLILTKLVASGMRIVGEKVTRCVVRGITLA